MGGIASVATTAIQALNAVNTVVGAIDGYQEKSGTRAYDQAKTMNDLELRQKKEDAALQKEQIRLAAESTDAERRAALRRAVARQRAAYGSGGTGSSDGSAQAVLLGLFDESEEERAQREALDALKTTAIDQGVSQQQRINTLQLTQLKERNRLKKVGSAIDLVTSIF